jgi:hypothetical protein
VRKRRVAQTRFPIYARGLEGFAPLAERSRYAIAESHTAVVSEQVLLAAAATVPPRNERRVYVWQRSVALDEATAARRAQP